MAFWTDIFTLETWAQAEAKEFSVSGFPAPTPGPGGYSERMFNRVRSGDVLLCYCKRPAQRWVGALTVVEGPFQSSEPVWGFDPAGAPRFPWRFEVQPAITLAPEFGLPGRIAARELSCLSKLGPKWGVYLQRSLNPIPESDGTALLRILAQPRESEPISSADARRGAKLIPEPGVLDTIAESAKPLVPIEEPISDEYIARVHTEIQGMLRDIGRREGHDVWVADRGLIWQGARLGEGCLETLPPVGPPESQRIMRNIDVIWFRRGTAQPINLFEIENSTSVYSGLLRFNDVIIDYPLPSAFIVGPDEVLAKFQREINRRTFAHSGLREITRFLTYQAVRRLWERYQAVGGGSIDWS